MNPVWNGDFSDWPLGENGRPKVQHVVAGMERICPGFSVASGSNGEAIVSRRRVSIADAGVPSSSRFAVRIETVEIGGEASGWRTILMHGEAHGAPASLGGVRRFAGQNGVLTSVFARVVAGPATNIRIIRWQGFGHGNGPSAAVYLGAGSSGAAVGSSWTEIGQSENVPSLAGKTIGSLGGDDFGLGVDVPYNFVGTIELCLPREGLSA